ncbi:hypothetical protein APHCRT_0283 [Anaplasma phagocytophilum str. CRT53-1]|uniref:Uncharacterized protein n=1 Tax=Anaplasma phagocytophilum str. CRT53-1 TaxID=1359157 RepID=A0A0F3Q8W6_ANAPH|nr:hypothetical protein APHCRT_0283 [Anaplasma phagocytophilum str. CRT53-1]
MDNTPFSQITVLNAILSTITFHPYLTQHKHKKLPTDKRPCCCLDTMFEKMAACMPLSTCPGHTIDT